MNTTENDSPKENALHVYRVSERKTTRRLVPDHLQLSGQESDPVFTDTETSEISLIRHTSTAGSTVLTSSAALSSGELRTYK